MQPVAIVDYGVGNLRSAQKAIERAGHPAEITSDPARIAAAPAVVLPGQGAFGTCMENLAAAGLVEAVRQAACSGRPFLGICIGMQLLFEESEESPGVRGLGVLAGTVRALPAGVKHPQMQWNRLVRRPERPSAMLEALGESPWAYFVHSFAPEDGPDVVATCDYGAPVVAACERGPIWGTQFHPEKSGTVGLAMLSAFARRAARTGAADAR